MADRPKNHVAAAMSHRLGLGDVSAPELPLLPEEHIARLEAIFPARCLEPHEDVALHIRYAANVSLVQSLRLRFEYAEAARLRGAVDFSDLDDLDHPQTGIPSGAERAS